MFQTSCCIRGKVIVIERLRSEDTAFEWGKSHIFAGKRKPAMSDVSIADALSATILIPGGFSTPGGFHRSLPLLVSTTRPKRGSAVSIATVTALCPSREVLL